MPNWSKPAAKRAISGSAPRPRQRAADAAAEHADLRAQFLGHEFEFGDRLFGRVHRDHRRRRQPVAEPVEIFGRDDVEAADHRTPRLIIGDARDAEPGGRVDDAEIDPEFVEPVIEHARHHRGGAVAGVGRLPPPIALHRDAAALPLGDREPQCVGNAALRCEKPVGRLVAGNLAHPLGEDRRVFDPMPVAVDDGVAQPGTDLFGAHMRAHSLSSDGLRRSRVVAFLEARRARRASQTVAPGKPASSPPGR